MLKRSLASNMKIRTSIVLVLVFYLIMLIAGAALGVLSLGAGNSSLEYIVQNQRAGASLAQSIDGYRNVQQALARAAAARVFGTASEVEAILSEGRAHLDSAQRSFKTFQEIAVNTAVGNELAPRVTQHFNDLVDNGVQPMLRALAAGQDTEYERLATASCRSSSKICSTPGVRCAQPSRP